MGAQAVPPYVGSSEVHNFPPAEPTNRFPELFPSNVGYAGPTPTGAEPAVVATAPSWPMHTGAPHLVVPGRLGKASHDHGDEVENKGDLKKSKGKGGKNRKFNMLEKWGNLSPWYSIERGGFGVDSSPGTPDTCRITGLHFVHRHGARYPTEWTRYGGPANLASKLHSTTKGWTGSGQLDFLNDWTYKLGAERLTPFGRQQLFDLGVTMRMKYGFLLQNFTDSNTIPVFRTESQDRMLASAMNFALGFFGWPYDGQYQQSITIEADGFNNTLSPYKTCPNAGDNDKADRGIWYVRRWADIYLKDARERLADEIKGFDLTVEDVYTMQQMCSYETVAIGYSKFCELFTEEEWEGFNYALDLHFWYGSAFGSPVARVQGIGWIQELVARLTHTPIAVHNSSTNSTLDDNSVTFPLDQSLYVDATHEVVVLNIITALNLTGFAEQGPLPYTHIMKDRAFRSSEIAPFATNIQLQLLECTSVPGPQIRIIINDGVAPLTGINGCPEQQDGMCPLETFIEAMRENIKNTDWNWDCHGDWTVPEGTQWNTTTGDPPKRN
ncbi:phytase [Macrolepiota fuliginosa MF-IS2]|uniref:Phytase n=1 Tax=Macrolepiota fuliginosa MF-IS2 TaxID=1400762 RepID=A0A9P5XLH8_9AGAR|nr:phytase [Macrolepiota fuliginosa MF-IS2]